MFFFAIQKHIFMMNSNVSFTVRTKQNKSIWIKPEKKTLNERSKNSISIQYIEKLITCSIPFPYDSDDLFAFIQRHFNHNNNKFFSLVFSSSSSKSLIYCWKSNLYLCTVIVIVIDKHIFNEMNLFSLCKDLLLILFAHIFHSFFIIRIVFAIKLKT